MTPQHPRAAARAGNETRMTVAWSVRHGRGRPGATGKPAAQARKGAARAGARKPAWWAGAYKTFAYPKKLWKRSHFVFVRFHKTICGLWRERGNRARGPEPGPLGASQRGPSVPHRPLLARAWATGIRVADLPDRRGAAQRPAVRLSALSCTNSAGGAPAPAPWCCGLGVRSRARPGRTMAKSSQRLAGSSARVGHVAGTATMPAVHANRFVGSPRPRRLPWRPEPATPACRASHVGRLAGLEPDPAGLTSERWRTLDPGFGLGTGAATDDSDSEPAQRLTIRTRNRLSD